MKTLLSCITATLLLTPPGPVAAFDDPLPAPVAAALAQAGLPPDALGAIAIPQTFWARMWQHRADVPMQPGSSMKLVTTIVALDRLGPNHRGRTVLHSRPWGEVLRNMNKASDNAQTRLLFLQLGVAAMKADPNSTTLSAAQRDVQR